MDSATIRWILAGLFVVFVIGVVFNDLFKRRSNASKQRREPKQPQGFKPPRPTGPQPRQPNWKTGGRR